MCSGRGRVGLNMSSGWQQSSVTWTEFSELGLPRFPLAFDPSCDSVSPHSFLTGRLAVQVSKRRSLMLAITNLAERACTRRGSLGSDKSNW